jgi:hypothetical protein
MTFATNERHHNQVKEYPTRLKGVILEARTRVPDQCHASSVHKMDRIETAGQDKES